MKEFLAHYVKLEKGEVLNEEGKIIGSHDGAILYTIGERRGFKIDEKTPDDKPYYVVSKDISKNTITVSNKTTQDCPVYTGQSCVVRDVNWISGHAPDFSKKYSARIRYRQALQECRVKSQELGVKIVFETPQDSIASGQSLVLYDGDECLGGGIID